MGEANDGQLVKRIKKSDRAAFRIIHNRYYKKLYFVALKYLKDEDLVQDAIQDIFLKLWNMREDLDASKNVSSLLFTMLKHHLLNMLRKRKNGRKILERYRELYEERYAGKGADEDLIYEDYKRILKEALEKLSPAKREVFEKRSIEGLSNEEVAKEKDVSVNTVKTQFYLGSKFIRKYLKKHGDS